jgi:AcrR family transcriptional regulator
MIRARMARTAPPDRYERLIDAATRVFLDLGYRRAQMDDVARSAGVAKGTLYLYFESKEALFDAALRSADQPRPISPPRSLPVPTPRRGTTLQAVRRRLAEEQRFPALAKALGRRRAIGVRAELEAIVAELYAVFHRNRTGIKLLDRCAHDYPELADIWFRHGRGGLLERLGRFLESRVRAKRLRAVADLPAAARFLLETVVFWAVHRHWDPAPQEIEDDTARRLVTELVCRAFVGSREG